ncbi:nitrous oxide reductase accessory protein NosL [Sulfurovum sp. zt1-1]|uniref:Nitrous oxide reductase accessory protein NosL n=1 Tax=Sulfurovum zhangzhouensis TaxID=3019067 RepID=A0ABT7QXA0_9BACT|nr:nitrous oxide reductase accessory protein NosL [Sulfurovum zhangzhouensis]MDM5271450.1 nitrous oxide reductase accessory protein NosL [Sulfurovum zhangzhouensis]
MKKTIFIFFIILLLPLFANDISQAKVIKLTQKGEKIVKNMCKIDNLPSATGTIDLLIQKIKDSQACPSLSPSQLEAVAYYISDGSMKAQKGHIHVPQGAKCPVCGMFVAKYPKWAALITHDEEQTYYFDGVKDMMKYYIFDGNFPFERDRITMMKVTDYYSLEAIDAKSAFYVYDSNVYGPMGRELIPFITLDDAKTFSREHQGKRILHFNEITDAMVMALDGL